MGKQKLTLKEKILFGGVALVLVACVVGVILCRTGFMSAWLAGDDYHDLAGLEGVEVPATDTAPALGDITIDTTGMDKDDAYAYAYSLSMAPDRYAGQTVRVTGVFSHANEGGYDQVVVLDEDGCCSAGVEFVLPDGVERPSTGQKITVTGVLQLYEEDGLAYGHLVSCELEEA